MERIPFFLSLASLFAIGQNDNDIAVQKEPRSSLLVKKVHIFSYLVLSMVQSTPSPFEVFTNVHDVIHINRWAYGILLWEMFTIGAYIMSTFA